MITIKQCKAARVLLDWRQHHLAKAANISMSTLADYESGRREPVTNNMRAIKGALLSAGILFIGLTGVDLPERK